MTYAMPLHTGADSTTDALLHGPATVELSSAIVMPSMKSASSGKWMWKSKMLVCCAWCVCVGGEEEEEEGKEGSKQARTRKGRERQTEGAKAGRRRTGERRERMEGWRQGTRKVSKRANALCVGACDARFDAQTVREMRRKRRAV